MKPKDNVTRYLDLKKIPYEILHHPRRETAIQTAEVEHIPAYRMVKVVMVRLGDQDAMFLIPADRVLDLFKVGFALDTKDIYVEGEREFRMLFPDCETGAMPPIGSLYGVPCYMDVALEDEPEVYFNAGSHEDLIRMKSRDFIQLAGAEIGDYSIPRKTHRAA